MTAVPEVPPAGAHGGDAAAVEAALGLRAGELLDLSQTLNPVAPDPLDVLTRHLHAVRRYPDATPALRSLSSAMDINPDRLLLTSGGASAIALVASLVGRGSVTEPEFSGFRRHLKVDPTAGRWRSNPNNPTGLLAPENARAAVWDEAFYPLATGEWTRGDAADGAIVIGSLTKLLACPGLRVGYVHATPDVIERLAGRQPEWPVSGLACAAIPEMLEGVDLAGWSEEIRRLRTRLVALLDGVGCRAEPSDAPWVLADVGDAAAARADLARAGVLVRDSTSFGMPRHIRIAVPPARDLDRLEQALNQWRSTK